jgi:hypothetical protein
MMPVRVCSKRRKNSILPTVLANRLIILCGERKDPTVRFHEGTRHALLVFHDFVVDGVAGSRIYLLGGMLPPIGSKS